MPRLSIVPTPIGNLEDVTLRVLRVLREADVIFAEDTRHTRKLLSHFQIPARVRSYHQHNKRDRIGDILAALREHDVALVSDAGMPGIADPGFELIVAAVGAGVEIDVLPGPMAAVTAVVAAALPAPGFLYLGFLPRRSSERRERLEDLRSLPFSLVLYEAPHRLRATLSDLRTVLGDRQAFVGRELTKLHQEMVRGSLSEIATHFGSGPVRGECTVVVAGASEQPPALDEARQELLVRRRAGQDRRSAIALVVSKYGVSRNAVYRAWINAEREERDALP